MRLLTRERAVSQSRKVVSHEGQDGETYDFEIRRLGADELITAGVIPADAVLDDVELAAAAKVVADKAQKKAVREKAAQKVNDLVGQKAKGVLRENIAAKVDWVITAGVTRPRVWDGPEADCPEGAIPLADMGQFRDRLFADIVGFSTANKEAKEAARFPDRDGAGGSGGDDGEPVGAAADGAHG